jgi:tagaturonate reductase
MAEPFSLWAIESNSPKVKSLLSFVDEKNGCIVVPNIEKFKELKLRVLNGSHSFACGLAFLSGFEFVRSTMKDQSFLSFLKNLAYEEIVPTISGNLIKTEEAEQFAFNVLERFSNPFIDHKWASIAVQYSSKMRMRNIPLLIAYYQKKNQFPPYMALGFAGFLLYMKSQESSPGVFEGNCQGINYIINDDHAAYFSGLWNSHGADGIVKETLSDIGFWGHDLMQIAGFEKEVTKNLRFLIEKGVLHIISSIIKIT